MILDIQIPAHEGMPAYRAILDYRPTDNLTAHQLGLLDYRAARHRAHLPPYRETPSLAGVVAGEEP